MKTHSPELQARLETTLARYVAMPTESTNLAANAEAIKTLADEFVGLGMTVHVENQIYPWLIATANPRAHANRHVKVLLALHFDVVGPAHENHYTVKMTKDKIFGRGVIDMKFASAVCHELVKDLAAADTLCAYDFGILITSDEERGGNDGARDFIQKGWKADIAIVPDGGRDWKVEARAKGLRYLYLKSTGLSAHSSRTWEGKSPLPTFLPALQTIMAKFPNDDSSGIVVGINTVETTNSGALNSTQTPGWIKAGISIRAFEENQVQAAEQFIKDVAKKHGLSIETTLKDSPVHIMREHPLVQQFLETLRELRDKPLEFSEALGASDARYFAAAHIPTAVLYPEGGDLHGANEWIKRSDLSQFYELLKQYLHKTAFNPDNLSLGRARRFMKYKKAITNLVRSVRAK